MKKLNREKVIRMVGGEINNRIGISSSGGSGGGGLAGAATQAWVDANYVSIEFFDRLFQAYEGTGSSATRVNANDTESTIDNIKAMFGFWTDQYLSALGQGSGGGGGGGAEALSDLLDVELTTLQNGQALIYSSALGKWTNGTAGVNMTQVWSALDSATNEQINVSHLTNALSGYVTTSAISDMATQTWVGQQGYATQTWVNQNFITIAFFDRLFQVYEGTGSSATRVNPNDTTSTIDNIKAMFGFWTEFYLAALGDGGASSGSISLGMLSDVSLSIPTDGQALVFDATLGIWKNGTVGGTDMSSVWTNLAAATNEQINASHLTDALLNYNPTNNFKTINGQSLIGTGDLSVGGGASGNYLPLAGGTLVGALGLNFSSSSAVITINDTKATTSYTMRAYSPNLNTNNAVFFDFGKTTSSKNSGHIAFKYLGNSSNSNYITLGLYGVDNQFVLNGAGNVGVGTSSPSTKLNVNGTTGDPTPVVLINGTRTGTFNFVLNATVDDLISGTRSLLLLGKSATGNNSGVISYYHSSDASSSNYLSFGMFGTNDILNIYPNRSVSIISENKDGALFIENKNSTSSTRGIDIVFNRQPTSGFDAPLIFGVNNSTYNKGVLTFGYRGNGSSANYVGLGLYGKDNIFTVCANGNAGIGTTSPSYKLHVDGNIYATGGVTALSDARHKTIINPTKLQVEQIARMPAVVYRWNDGREDNGLHVGSIAQDWQRVLPEVVMRANDKEGTLSMQYGVAALVSSIITARKVVDHERRIKELERENKELKMKLKIA